jgi:hypothetical protein
MLVESVLDFMIPMGEDMFDKPLWGFAVPLTLLASRSQVALSAFAIRFDSAWFQCRPRRVPDQGASAVLPTRPE